MKQSSNAIHYASELIQYLQDQGARYSAENHTGSYETPHSTTQVGLIKGGVARNMIADTCRMEYEFHHLPQNSADQFSKALEDHIETELLPSIVQKELNAWIETKVLSNVPAFRAVRDGALLKALQCSLGHRQTANGMV